MALDTVVEEMRKYDYNEASMEALEQVRNSCSLTVKVLNNLMTTKMMDDGIMFLQKTFLPVFPLVLDMVTPMIIKVNTSQVTRLYRYLS